MEKYHKQCLICGSPNLKKMPKYAKDHLVQCPQCSFVFSQRIPSDEELSAYYKNYGAGQHHSISPITIQRYHELLDQFEKYRHSNNLLDVGCGSGHFLATAKSRGWNVYGTEYPESLCEVSRKKGITIHRGPLQVENYNGSQFDVVTSFEVIEHIYNPKEELQKIKILLRSKGLFYCTTPNFNAIQRFQQGPEFNIFAYPEHISYYTGKTLKNVCGNTGLRFVRVESTGYSFSRATPKKVQVTKVTGEGSPDEIARKKIESSAALRLAKHIINRVLTISGTGITLKGYFEKP